MTALAEALPPRAFSLPGQYAWAAVIPLAVTAACWRIAPSTGYMFVGMVYLLVVIFAALRFERGPVLAIATLSVLVWDYFYIPPRFDLRIEKVQDSFMCGMVYLLALLMLASLLKHREMAERRRLGQVAARTLLDSVSHELKTPLAALQAAADGLQRDPAQTARYLPELHRAVRRLRRTVGNLLDMTRLESGVLQPVMDWCDVTDIFDAALDLTADALSAHPLTRDIPENLPTVKLDQALIEQAFANLLLNAAMHTPEGTPVTLRARWEPPRLTLSILDGGPGIPHEDPEGLFQKFTRGQRAPSGGSGLGLSIARGFARAHGGEAAARSRPGGGAEFFLSLPVQILDETLPTPHPAAGPHH